MMGWPQIVYIILIGMDLGCALMRHGKPREGKDSFWITFCADAVSLTLLWFGGFWR